MLQPAVVEEARVAPTRDDVAYQLRRAHALAQAGEYVGDVITLARLKAEKVGEDCVWWCEHEVVLVRDVLAKQGARHDYLEAAAAPVDPVADFDAFFLPDDLPPQTEESEEDEGAPPPRAPSRDGSFDITEIPF